MQPDPTTPEAIETLLRNLTAQLTKARNAAALAYEYLDLDTAQIAFGTLLGVGDAINQAAAMYNAILTLFRNQRPTP